MSGLRRGLPPAPAVPAPADKRFRRSDVRPGRRTKAALGWRLAVWAALVVVFACTGAWATRIVLRASFLRVQHITVRGNTRLSAGEVETLLDGIRAQNVFQVNLEHYKQRLMDSPWIAGATLWRVLPSTIEVRVSERVPLVVARLGQQLYLVDDTGAVIDDYGPQYREFDLPIVDGLASSPAAATFASADRVRLVSALLASLAARPDVRGRLSQVDVSNPRDAVVMLDDGPAWLHLGDTKFVERLGTYLELAPTLSDRFATVDYVDLRFDDRVFVRPRAKTVGLVRTGR